MAEALCQTCFNSYVINFIYIEKLNLNLCRVIFYLNLILEILETRLKTNPFISEFNKLVGRSLGNDNCILFQILMRELHLVFWELNYILFCHFEDKYFICVRALNCGISGV